MKRYVKIIALALIAMSALTTCRTNKNIVKSQTDTVISPASLPERLAAYNGQFMEWNDVVIPFKLKVSGEQSLSVSGRATMVRGKVVHLSVRVLGFEVARLHLNNEYVYAMEKVKNRYVAEPLEKLQRDFPLDINNIQDLLLGRQSRIENGDKSTEAMLDMVDTRHWKASYDNLAPFLYSFLFSSDNTLERFDGKWEEKSVDVVIDYSGQFVTAYGVFPSVADVSVKARNRTLNARLEWNFSAAKWNAGANPVWTMPQGYKRISSRNLIEMLSGK